MPGNELLDPPREAVTYFRDLIAEKRYLSAAGARYGLTDALLRARDYAGARKAYADLAAVLKQHPAVDLLGCRVKLAAGDADTLTCFRAALQRYPDYRALTYDFAETLLQNRQPAEALKIVEPRIGASTADPADISTFSHMFGCWETLYVIKHAMEAAGYQGPDDKAKLVEATEAMTDFAEGNEHPQGAKKFNGKIHQSFGHQNITQVKGGVAEVVYRTTIEEGLYEPEGDYTTQAL